MGSEGEIQKAILEATRYGVDLNLLEENLSLSPQERMEQHQSALDLVWELEQAGEKLYSRFKQTS